MADSVSTGSRIDLFLWFLLGRRNRSRNAVRPHTLLVCGNGNKVVVSDSSKQNQSYNARFAGDGFGSTSYALE